MEKRFFFLPISIARIKINFVKNFNSKRICSVGKAQLNNEGLSNFAGGSVDILDEENNKLVIIEGVVARRFEEKGNKNEEKINFEEWLMLIRPEKDIAILGVSGTFSGCESVEEFWEAIRDNYSCLSTLKNNNPAIIPISGICPNIEKFDINLFGKAGLSITEWRRLDPQIRLLAQHSYTALENSGNLERKSQIRVGCFVAAEESSPEYKEVDEREGALGSLLGMYRRNQQTFCAQWLSHLLELTGPSINVYSACSSSFSAIAQAQQAIVTGEADLCLVGAVHLVHPNQIGHQPMPGQPLAKSSNSWPFCSTSDGLMRGSACAVIVLGKPIEAILRGDPILGIIKSVAINNDAGRKPNFMSPSIEGQQAIINPFWECHAAGTTIGDNIELSAIYKAFFKEKTEGEEINNLFVGSCKANIGHCFAASGICSIIKLLKMLETGLLPPQLLPNNDVVFADLLNPFNGQLIIHSGSEAKEILPSKINAPLYFGSSNFGIGGTNGAVIIMSGLTNDSLKKAASEWRKDNKKASEINKGLFNNEATQYRLFPISAESKNSLRGFASKLAEYIREARKNFRKNFLKFFENFFQKNPKLDEISNTLLSRRENHQRFRAFVLARNLEELTNGLIRIANNEDIVENSGNNEENLAVFFSPQGVQFPGMFKTERSLFPSLNTKLVDICKQLGNNEEHFQQLINYLMDEIKEEKNFKNKIFSKNLSPSPSIIQCALFAIYQSLWIFLSEICNFKIKSAPIIFFGHSFGELSALCAAGGFTKNEGMKLLWKRGELIERTEPAKMVMIKQEESQNQNLQLELPHQVYLSARLSPTISVYVGKPSIIEKLARREFKEENNQKIISTKILEKINFGYHSKEFMAPILEEFKFSLLKLFNKKIKLLEGIVLSNLNGKELINLDIPEYLTRQLSETVRLDLCFQTLLRDYPRTSFLLEIGPPGILPQLLKEAEDDLEINLNKKIKVINTMERERKFTGEIKEEPPQLLKALAQIWQNGYSVNFNLLFNSYNEEWDNKMPGYNFDYLELNPSKEEMLQKCFPFNLSTKNKENERVTVDGENKIIKDKQENLNVKLKGGGLTKEKLTEIVVKTWNDYMPFASGEAEGEKNFILSGGNSIQAAQISWELSKHLNISYGQLSIELIFKYPKIGDFIEEIWKIIKNKEENEYFDQEEENKNLTRNSEENEGKTTNKLEAQIKSTQPTLLQTSLPLFLPLRNEKTKNLNNQKILNIFVFTQLVARLFYIDIWLEFYLYGQMFLGELAKYYAEKIEDYTKEAPLLLIGHSLGGVLAYEIALILNQKYLNCSSNLRVPLIIMFDSWATGQELICPKKAKQFVLDRFNHFSIHQCNSLSVGAEKLAGFLSTHKFIANIELSPEIWLFTAAKKIKLVFSFYPAHLLINYFVLRTSNGCSRCCCC
uniref:oleoyl-[acyl-carrier-protein] hydrolase n=1 Tax=Meloidogyne enterolobii TaxID=390850 RepID=A0A6V7V987_MELEN|nr:unnamed protein product [Meloidogyne enterolobii]